MSVPDMGMAFDDLEIEDMMVDSTIFDQSLQGEVGLKEKSDVGCMQQQDHAMREVIERSRATTSAYKQAALSDLQIGKTQCHESNREARMFEEQLLPGMKISDGDNNSMPIAEGGNADLGEEIARVMMRVDTAMEALPECEGARRMKKEIETSSDEVRKLACLLNTNDNVEAVMLKDDGAVLLISSESSGDSGQKKRKRRDQGNSKIGAVASRLRKKEKKDGNKSESKAMAGGEGKKKKMAVRKIKVSATKPTTSLTLAPPMLGLPTP